MAQLHFTLDQEEILQLFSENSGEAFKALLRSSLNTILAAESAEQLKAQPYERAEERVGVRNGTRERSILLRKISTLACGGLDCASSLCYRVVKGLCPTPCDKSPEEIYPHIRT